MEIKSALFLTMLLTSAISHANFTGTVVDVLDGGRVVVNTGEENKVVKLKALTTPFPNQNMYLQSRTVLDRIFLNRSVTVVTENKMEDRCIRGELMSNGINLNEALLLTGYAWIFDSAESTENYNQIESLNKSSGVGLWNPNFHFVFNDISLPPSTMLNICLTNGFSDTPEEDQYAFFAEKNKFNYALALKGILIGSVIGVLCWFGLMRFDRSGFDFFRFFRKKKNKKEGDI